MMAGTVFRILSIAVILLNVVPAVAVEPDEVLSDPILEQRARAISANLRCVVCLNQSIDSSNAGIARDLRLLVRKRLETGDTDDQVYAYVVKRYGDYVLLNPPFKPTTYVLWLVPVVFSVLGVLVIGIILVRAQRAVRAENDRLEARRSERGTIAAGER